MEEADTGRPRLAIPGTWLAGGFVAIAVALIVVHTVLTPTAGAVQTTAAAADAGLASNPNLDPGTSLSEVAPDFTLTDQFGQPVSLSSYRGKVVILAFNDSECSSVCPLTTTALVDAKAMLGAAASQVQLLGIERQPEGRPRSRTCCPTRKCTGCSTSGGTSPGRCRSCRPCGRTTASESPSTRTRSTTSPRSS